MPTIKVSLNFSNLKPYDFLVRCRLVHDGMKTNSSIFPAPPVDLELLKTKSDEYQDWMNRAVDSRQAGRERDSAKATLVGILRQLGTYVEAVAADISDVLASGFEPAYTSRQSSGPLAPAKMKKLKHGPTSGTIEAFFESIENARYYQLAYTASQLQIAENEWKIIDAFVARFPTVVTGLISGTVYAFRVRAFGPGGWTDWSDVMTIMCV